MKKEIKLIFDNVKYFKEKKYLLKAIPSEYYLRGNISIQLLYISSNNVSVDDEAKRQMWNHMIVEEKMGDDILNKMDNNILNDIDFAKKAISRYNRTYIYLSEQLQNNYDIATLTVTNEIIDTKKYIAPILMYMPDEFQNDIDISLIASSRNIHNIQYAPKLQKNKYFIIDIMNTITSIEDKRKVLSYIDQSFLEDKIFVSKLGCFDNLCDKFQGDVVYVSHAVQHDIDILKKTKLFDESIIKSIIQSDYYHEHHNDAISKLFIYIKQFNDSFDEFDSKIKDKTIINKLMWDMGELITDGSLY